MPLNGNGTYTPPAGAFPAVAGTLIQAADFNEVVLDISEALSTALYRDGQATWEAATQTLTGATLAGGVGVTVTGTFNFTTNLTVPTLPATTNNTQVANTAFVQSVAFSAALPAQSVGLLTSDGAIASFTPSLAFGLNLGRATVASHATTADIWAALGNQIDFTGTATVTAFPAAPQAGANRVLVCAGACSFTAGANLLISGIASGATVPCEANDQVLVQALSTTQFLLTIIPYAGAQIRTGMIFDFAGITVPSNFLACDGSAVARASYPRLFNTLTTSLGTFTITIAAPGIATLVAHGRQTGDQISLTTTGALPTGLVIDTNYFVIRISADTLSLATSYANAFAGTAIDTTGSQSGVHTMRYNPWGISGAVNFLLPDFNRRAAVGSGGIATATIGNRLGNVGGAETHTLSIAEMPAHTHEYDGNNTGLGTRPYWITPANDGDPRTTTSTGGSAAHNNMQPSGVVNKIIKT